MTCAPRGIFSTTSESVGRSTKKQRSVLTVMSEPSRCADDVVVLDDAGVGVKRGARLQGDEVVAVLRVDEHDAFAGFEPGAAHALWRRARLAERESMKRKSKAASPSVNQTGERWAQARPKAPSAA